MANEKKFVYKISAEADYKGEQELAALRKDLKKVADVRAYEKLTAGWKKTRTELAAAKQRAKELQVELKKGGGKEVEKRFAAANREVAKLTKSLASQKPSVLSATAALKSQGIAVNKTAEEYKKLEASATQQAKKIAAVNKLGVRTSADIKADIKAREKAYNDLKTSGVADLKTLARAEKALKKQTSALRQELDGVDDSAAGIGDVATGIAGGIASIGATAKAVQATQFFTGLEDDLLAAKAFSGATEEQLVQLKNAAYSMADGSAGPEALADGFAVLANAGMNVNEVLGTAGIVKNMTAASRGALDFASSGDMLTDVINLYNLKISDAAAVGDVLVKGWTSAAQSADQLGEGMTEAGAIVAKVYENLSKTEQLQKTTAIISALADAGFKGGKGGTALKNGLRQLIKPGNEARAVLEKYKDTIKVFDDTGNIRNFADIIDDIRRAGLSAQESMALFGSEAGPAMAALVNRGGDAIRVLEQKIKDADGAAKDTAETMQKGLGGSIRNTSAQFGVLTAKLVDSVKPALVVIVDSVGKVATAIGNLPTPVLAAGVAFTGLAVAGGAAISAIAVWSTVGPTVVAAVATLKTAAIALGGGLTALRAAISATVVSMGVLGTASVALAGAWGVVKIMEAVDAYGQMRDAQKMAAAAGERAEQQQAKYQARLKRVSDVLGTQVTSYKDVQAAVREGKLTYDAETDTYSKGSGVRIAAIESVNAAKKKSIEIDQKELEKIEELFDKYTEKIKEVERAIKDVSAGGASDLFELGLIGKSEQETWNAWRDSAKGLGEQIRSTVAEAKQLAAAGNIDAANAKFAEAVQLGKTMQSQYKGLAKVIKNEFGPAQEAALKAAKQNVSDLSREGTKAIAEYNKALNKLKATSGQLASAQQELEEQLRANAQSSMSAAAAYDDQAKFAQKLASESQKAAAAGNWDLAIEKARQSKEAYKELEGAANDLYQSQRDEIEKTKDADLAALESRKLSAEAAASERERIERDAQAAIAALSSKDTGQKASQSGVAGAIELEIAALEKKEAAEKAAVAAAKARSEEVATAKEKELEKVAALEKEKEGIAQTAEESAKVAQEGVKEAVELVNGALESQKDILEEITKNLDDNTGGAITRLKDQSGEFEKQWTAAAKTMGDETVRQAERASRALDDAAKARTAVITTKTVEGRMLGGLIGSVTAMSGGGHYQPRNASRGIHFPGYGGGDQPRNLVMAENGEVMLRKEAVRAGGLDTALAFNRRNFPVVARNLLKMPGVAKNIFGNISLPAIPHLPAEVAAPQGFVPGNLPGIELHDILTDQREPIISTPSGLEMITREMARARRMKTSGF